MPQRDKPFDIKGGGARIFLKYSKCFLSTLNFFEAHFPRSYKGIQITQKLTCRPKHVDLLEASNPLN